MQATHSSVRFTAAEAIDDPFLLGRSAVLAILRDHSADVVDFDDSLGARDEYWSDDVLGWLGY